MYGMPVAYGVCTVLYGRDAYSELLAPNLLVCCSWAPVLGNCVTLTPELEEFGVRAPEKSRSSLPDLLLAESFPLAGKSGFAVEGGTSTDCGDTFAPFVAAVVTAAAAPVAADVFTSVLAGLVGVALTSSLSLPRSNLL